MKKNYHSLSNFLIYYKEEEFHLKKNKEKESLKK